MSHALYNAATQERLPVPSTKPLPLPIMVKRRKPSKPYNTRFLDISDWIYLDPPTSSRFWTPLRLLLKSIRNWRNR